MEGNKMGMREYHFFLEWGRRKYSFLSIILKSQIFIPPKLGGIERNKIRFNEFFY